MNDPFGKPKSDGSEPEEYHIYDENITGFNKTQWEQIKSQDEFQKDNVTL